LIECRAIVESEGKRIDIEEYVNDIDPSILRFLLVIEKRFVVFLYFIVYVYYVFINVCCYIFEMCIHLLTL